VLMPDRVGGGKGGEFVGELTEGLRVELVWIDVGL
jgi:hypothetical protein